jgi:C2 domain
LGKSDPFFVISGTPYPTVSLPYFPYAQLMYAASTQPANYLRVGRATPQQKAQKKMKKKDKLSGMSGEKGAGAAIRSPKKLSAGGVPLFVSKVINKELNPVWDAPVQLDTELCGGLDAKLEICVYDYDNNGHHDLIGSFKTSLRELAIEETPIWELTAIRYDDEGQPYTVQTGHFHVESAENVSQEVMQTPPKLPYAIKLDIRARDVDRKDAGRFSNTMFAVWSSFVRSFFFADCLFLFFVGGLGKSDPFAAIIGIPYGCSNAVTIAKTETKQNDLNPSWNTLTIETSALGGMDSFFTVTVYDEDQNNVRFLCFRSKAVVLLTPLFVVGP